MPRMPRRGRFTRRNTDSTHATNSSGRSRHPLELYKSAHVVAEVHHPDLEPRPRHADGAHELAAHRVLLVAEHMLDTRAHLRARRVGGLLRRRERTIARRAPMDAALQAPRLELLLDLGRAVGAVGPHLATGVVSIQNVVELLAVVRRGVGGSPLADDLVQLVHADVVLVAVEALATLLGPARILVLLGVLGRFLLPLLRRLSGLDAIVLVLRVALLGRRHDGRVDDLAAPRNVALGLQVLAEAVKQR